MLGEEDTAALKGHTNIGAPRMAAARQRPKTCWPGAPLPGRHATACGGMRACFEIHSKSNMEPCAPCLNDGVTDAPCRATLRVPVFRATPPPHIQAVPPRPWGENQRHTASLLVVCSGVVFRACPL